MIIVIGTVCVPCLLEFHTAKTVGKLDRRFLCEQLILRNYSIMKNGAALFPKAPHPPPTCNFL